MKLKFFAAVIAAVAAFSLIYSDVGAAETAEEPLPDFSEDFETYETGKIENTPAFLQVWTNDYFKGDEAAADQQTNVARIETYGADGNKVLRVTNIEGDGSFFYIGLPDKYKNFTVSFKVKVLDAKTEAGGWFGINCRKENDARYNCTSGMLLTYRWYKETDGIFPATYRYLPGTQIILDPETVEDYGSSAAYYTYETYGECDDGEWIEYKISVYDCNYKMYANDVPVADFYYSKNAVNDFGYLSFNVCVCDLLMDDFYLENLDETAPPKDESASPDPHVNGSGSQSGNTGKENSGKKGCGSSASGTFLLPLFAFAAILSRKIRCGGIEQKNEKYN